MRKYSIVYDVVTRLTDNPTLHTFFILYLMAAPGKDRGKINQQFWEDAKVLEEVEYRALKLAFSASFKQLLPLADQLYNKIMSAKSTASATA